MPTDSVVGMFCKTRKAMTKVSKDHFIYSMSADNQPVLRVAVGAALTFETNDCFGGLLKSADDLFTQEKWSRVNPATGPVFIEGAKAGDILKVEIKAIRIRDHAVMIMVPGRGALGDAIKENETRLLPICDDGVEVMKGVFVPLRPMIGVIGTAPAGDAVPNGTPGEHGGNMDCRNIGVGTTLYLPVNVDGGLLSLGDLHATMGDGEVCVCGAEVSGEVDLVVTVDTANHPTPSVETADELMLIASAKTLDECEHLVLAKAHSYLIRDFNLSPNDAARVMSLAGDLGVCQVVDPLKTMKFSLPHAILRQLRARA